MYTVDMGRVRFEKGDPCRPKYEDLYQNPPDDQGILLEPALQVGEDIDTFEVRLELTAGDVEITDEDGRPLCRELNRPEARPEIRYDGPSAFLLTWNREEPLPATRVFRIYCRRGGQEPTDPEKVYGGIFVAVTTSVSRLRPSIPYSIVNEIKLSNIIVIGTDSDGRPVYDTFTPMEDNNKALPSGIELVPAFRAKTGQRLTFVMTMGIEFAVWDGKVEYIEPKGRRPTPLLEGYSRQKPKKYHFSWETKPTQESYLGDIVTFHLGATLKSSAQARSFPKRLRRLGFASWQDYQKALKLVNADPTIIQPPPCDPVYRVCSY